MRLLRLDLSIDFTPRPMVILVLGMMWMSNLMLIVSLSGMNAPPRGAKGVPRPAPRRKKRLLPCPAPPMEVFKLWGVCGAK